jgi:hypothetical protein
MIPQDPLAQLPVEVASTSFDLLQIALAVLHGSVGGRTEPAPSLCLSDADGLRAPKLKHAVQGLNGDGDLRRATSVRS